MPKQDQRKGRTESADTDEVVYAEAAEETTESSLTTEPLSRENFLDKFTGESGQKPEDQKKQSEEEEDDEAEADLEDEDDESSEEDSLNTDEQDVEESSVDDNAETEDEDADVDDIDLRDIEGLEDEEEDSVDPNFNVREDLPLKVWKKLPEEAKAHISNHRKLNKKLIREAEANKPLVQYTQQLLKDSEEVGVEPRTLNNWIQLGLRAQQNDASAIEEIGNLMSSAGYQPPEAPKLDLDSVRELLASKVEAFDLTPEQAKEILEGVKGAVKKPEGNAAQGRVMRTGPQAAPTEAQYQDAAQKAALDSIAEINKRFEKRYRRVWPQLHQRIKNKVILEQTQNPRSNPKQWVKLWAETAKSVCKAHAKRSEAQRNRKGIESSDSMSARGGSVRRGKVSENQQIEDPRENFLSKFTQ